MNAAISWSSGKDSAFALHLCRQNGMNVTHAVSTLRGNKVSAHGIGRNILLQQINAVRLIPALVHLPDPTPNGAYIEAMHAVCAALYKQGIRHIIFGDLFLEDIRAFREAMMQGTGIAPIFPLWRRDTDHLAREIIESGFEARLIAVDTQRLPQDYVGRLFNHDLLRCLPEGIDPCGENGEFHTLVTDGPIFSSPLAAHINGRYLQGAFAYADITQI